MRLIFQVVACMFVTISLDAVYRIIAALHLRKFSWFLHLTFDSDVKLLIFNCS